MEQASLKRSTILETLRRLRFAFKKNSIIPELDCIRLDISQKNIVFHCTDLEIYIEESLILMDGDEGIVADILVPFVWFWSILFNSDCEIVSLTVINQKEKHTASRLADTEYGRIFKMTCGEDEHEINVGGVSNYPRSFELENPKFKIVSDTDEFRQQITTAMKFVSDDDLRPSMTGVLMQYRKKDGIRVVSTDAHRMYWHASGLENISEGHAMMPDFILPKRMCTLISKNNLGPCTITFGDNMRMQIFSGSTRIICRGIDAKYPNYEVVIPRETILTARFDRKRFSRILKVAMFVANQSTRQVTLDIQHGLTKVKAQDIDYGHSSSFGIDCDCSKSIWKSTVKTAFNGKFMMEILSCLKEDVATIESNGKSTSVLVINGCFIIMPLMLSE